MAASQHATLVTSHALLLQWPTKAAWASVDEGGAAPTARKGGMQVLCIEVGPNGVRTQRLGAPPVLPGLKPVMVEASTQTEIFVAAPGDIELDVKHSGEQCAQTLPFHSYPILLHLTAIRPAAFAWSLLITFDARAPD